MTEQTATQEMLTCTQCKRTFGRSDVVQIAGNWVCGSCKTAFLSRVVAGGAPTVSNWHYGGFWIRFAAVLIDGIVMQIARLPLSLLIVGAVLLPFQTSRPGAAVSPAASRAVIMLSLVLVLLAFLYEVILIRYYGATLGKMAVGVKVVRTDGSEVGWGVSIGRYFMKYVSGLIMAIGYIMAGFDNEKRALHDRVCDTRVAYKRSLA